MTMLRSCTCIRSFFSTHQGIRRSTGSGAWSNNSSKTQQVIRRFLTSTPSDDDPAVGSLSELEQSRPRTVTGVLELDTVPAAADTSHTSSVAAGTPMALLHSNSFSFSQYENPK